MPVIGPSGSIVYGIDNTINIDGATPAALAAIDGSGGRWLSTALVFFADNTTVATMRTYNTSTLALANVMAHGANFTGAGNSVAATWLSGSGVDTTISGWTVLPNASLIEVSEAGLVALVTNASTGSGLSVYSAAGVLQLSINTTLAPATLNCRYGWLSYFDSGGWHVVDADTGDDHPNFVARANITLCMPVEVGPDLWVFEYETSSANFSLRNVATGKGWIVSTGATAGTNVNFFWPDARPHPTTANTIRLAGSLTAGEAVGDLIVIDVNLASGTTSRGTVSGGTIVYTTGPTFTAATFATTRTPNQVPPERQPLIDPRTPTGQPSREWLAYWEKTATNAQLALTRIGNLPVPVAPPGGGGGGGGIGGAPIDAQYLVGALDPTLTAERLATDSSSVTVNLSVPSQVTWHTVSPVMVYDRTLQCYVIDPAPAGVP